MRSFIAEIKLNGGGGGGALNLAPKRLRVSAAYVYAGALKRITLGEALLMTKCNSNPSVGREHLCHQNTRDERERRL